MDSSGMVDALNATIPHRARQENPMTASNKARLIRMAADLPKGDEKRRAILTGLKKAFVIDLVMEDEEAVTLSGADPLDDEEAIAVGSGAGSGGASMEDDEEAFVIDNVASDRSTLIRMAADLPKGDEKRRAILAGLSKTALEVDKYVAINVRGKEEMVVAVVGIDSRVIQSGETYLKAALRKLQVDVADRNPVKVPLPDDDEWGWMGFTVYGEPEALAEALKALKKEAKKLHMKVHEGRGRWPKPPRVY